jgi:zinc/manganese transport system ATP-binding protein
LTLLTANKATLSFGSRKIWDELNFAINRGEFIALIGANGTGKSTMLKGIIGTQELDSGSFDLEPGAAISYIPQHRTDDGYTPLKVKDLVRLGLDGHKPGLPWPSSSVRDKVTKALKAVQAEQLANDSIGNLSGGEMQRVRVAQAMIGDPDLILADEPLSNLDLNQQLVISELFEEQRQKTGAAVLFVTHDVNPIIDYVDRVLYLAPGGYRIGSTEEVMQSEVLSELYGADIDVVRNQGRIVVIGTHDHAHHAGEDWV